MTAIPARQQIRGNVLANITSSGVAFAITLATTPIITRLFAPQAYGVYAIISNLSVLLVGLGLLSLPNALPQETEEANQPGLIGAQLQLTALLTILTLVGSVGYFLVEKHWMEQSTIGLFVLILPLLVAANALQKVVDSVAILHDQFRALAKARLVNAVVARAATIAAGLILTGAATFMVLGDALGKLAQGVATIKSGRLQRALANKSGWFDGQSLRTAIAQNADFAVYANLTALLPAAVSLLLLAITAAAYSLEVAGQFTLARSMLALPGSLIALSTAPIAYRQFIAMAQTDQPRLRKVAMYTFLAACSTGLITLLPVFFWGPSLFGFVFGDSWQAAGRIAAILFVPYALEFSLILLSPLYRVMRRLRLWFVLELTSSVALVAGFLFAANGSPEQTMRTLAVLMVGRHVLIHWGCILIVRDRPAAQHQQR